MPGTYSNAASELDLLNLGPFCFLLGRSLGVVHMLGLLISYFRSANMPFAGLFK